MKSTKIPETPEKKWALLARIEPNILHWLGKIGTLENTQLYLVGGVVRDKFLGRKTLDIDIAVDGDVKKLGTKLAAELASCFEYHETFKTGSIKGPNNLHIDLAMTRTEKYPTPGQLPLVKKGTIDDDLLRRDFTINAMAIYLNQNGDLDKILDPTNGRKDLSKGLIRVLHNKSFQDDPTRIFRAVRYSVRFSFKIEPHTASLMRNAIKRIQYLSGERILYELRCINKEKKSIKINIFKNLLEHGILDFLGKPLVKFSWQSFDKLQTEENCEFLCLFLSHFNYEKLSRLPLSKKCLKTIETLQKQQEIFSQLTYISIPSKIFFFLRNFDERGLRILAETSASKQKDKITAYLDLYKKVIINTTGDDLKEMGLPPGPGYRKYLDKLLGIKIDGYIKEKVDEINMLKNWIKKEKE